MAQSKNTPSASAPLFIARSQSRALERAARSSAADHKRAAAATFFAFQSGIFSCFAKGPGPLCPRAASAWHVSISRNELTQKPISAYAEVSPSFARTRTHSATFRCVNGVVKSHGFACEVRVTSADTSSGATAERPRERARFSSTRHRDVPCLRPQARPKASRAGIGSWRCHAMSPWRAPETAIRMPCAARNR